jgi:hypothetical protein
MNRVPAGLGIFVPSTLAPAGSWSGGKTDVIAGILLKMLAVARSFSAAFTRAEVANS